MIRAARLVPFAASRGCAVLKPIGAGSDAQPVGVPRIEQTAQLRAGLLWARRTRVELTGGG